MKRKCASSDFVASMLPSNRRKQFIDLFKTRFSVLFKTFLASLLFAIPLLVSYCIKYFYVIANAYTELNGDQDAYLAFFKLTNIIFSGVDVLTFAILFIGYAGIVYIFKKICWSEPVSFWKDFFSGIKQNWAIFLATSLFVSIFRFATKTFAILSDYHFISYIVEAIFLLSLPIFFFGLDIYGIYDVKIFEAYQKGTLYYFKKFGFVLIFLIYPVVMIIERYYVEEFFGMGVLGFGLMLLNIVIVLPLIVLIWHLFCLSSLDENTNKEHFKEYYHKGLSDNYIFNKKYNDNDTFLLK